MGVGVVVQEGEGIRDAEGEGEMMSRMNAKEKKDQQKKKKQQQKYGDDTAVRPHGYS